MNTTTQRWLLITSLFLFNSQSVIANDGVEKLTQNPANWATWGGNYAATRYSPLAQINVDNVKNLQPAWMFSTGVLRGHEGGALVVDDIIYIHTPFPNTVYALNQKTQSIIWEYTPVQDADVTVPMMCCDTINRGVAYGDGKIFLQQANTVLTALDAKTGKPVWRVQNGNPKFGMTNTNAPLVVKNAVITGISGGEFGVRGFLAAYDIHDGHLLWKGYSTGADADMLINPEKTTTWTNGKVTPVGKDSSLKTWKGEQWKIGGGTTSGWYSYDPELNLIYYGSANPGTWNSTQRPGDNKWSDSLWARNADTGEVKWVYQLTPHDEWDFDATNKNVLIDQIMQGTLRKTLVHFDRNGFAYVLDRETGELLSAEKFDQSVNWATHIDKFSGRPQADAKYSPEKHGEDVRTDGICPAMFGAKNQAPVSYSPQTGLFYVLANHLCVNFEPFEVSYTAGQPFVGSSIDFVPANADVMTGKSLGVQPVLYEGKPITNSSGNLLTRLNDYSSGRFTAYDAKTGKIVWSKPERYEIWSGSLATEGNVIFYGTEEGYLKALNAKTGEELYKFKTPSGIIGNVNTWYYHGKQYVGVLSGIGGWAAPILLVYSDSYSIIRMLEEKILNETDPTKRAFLKKELFIRNQQTENSLGYDGGLGKHTKAGGVFTVFALPNNN